MVLNNQWVKEDITRDIKKYFQKNEKSKYNIPKLMGYSKSSSKKQVHSDKCLPQETSQINNLTLQLKALGPKLVEGRQ